VKDIQEDVSRKFRVKPSLFKPRDLPKGERRIRKLYKLQQSGAIEHLGHGIYQDLRVAMTQHHHLLEPAIRSPGGVVCLLSALQFHHLTTQQPSETWFAIENKAHPPKVSQSRLRIVRMSGPAIIEGVETHILEGVPVRVFSVAKTIVDCFKFRNKIGLDVALESLRECRQQKRCSVQDIWNFAKVCRVSNVIRPYLEALA
jgi:predicted transcriptional regulator of viral defense system